MLQIRVPRPQTTPTLAGQTITHPDASVSKHSLVFATCPLSSLISHPPAVKRPADAASGRTEAPCASTLISSGVQIKPTAKTHEKRKEGVRKGNRD